MLLFGLFCGCRGFCHRIESDLFLFLLFVMRGILCLTFTNRNGTTLKTFLTTPLDILTIYSPSITLNLRNIFLITSVEQSKYFRNINVFPWFKYKSYWQWYSYQRLRQSRWFRISYRQFPWLNGDIPRLLSYGVYISEFFRIARCCTSVSDFKIKRVPRDIRRA